MKKKAKFNVGDLITHKEHGKKIFRVVKKKWMDLWEKHDWWYQVEMKDTSGCGMAFYPNEIDMKLYKGKKTNVVKAAPFEGPIWESLLGKEGAKTFRNTKP